MLQTTLQSRHECPHWILFFLFFVELTLPTLGFTHRVYALINAFTVLFILIIIIIYRSSLTKCTAHVLLFLTLLSTLLISGSTLVGNYRDLIIQDLFDLHRPILYSLCFILPYSFRYSQQLYSSIYSALKLTLILQLLFVIAEYYLLPDLQYLYRPLIHSRTSGFFGTPYDFAYVLCLPLFYFFNRFCLKPHAVSFFLFLLTGFVMLKTLSRTGIILGALGLSFILLYSLIARKGWKIAILLILLIFFSASAGMDKVKNEYPYIYDGLNKLMTSGIQGESSTRKRFNDLERTIDRMNNYFVIMFGNGVKKSTFEGRFLESHYALYLNRYGVLGLCILFFIYFSAISLSWRSYRLMLRNPLFFREFTDFSFALFVWYLITPVAGFTNAFFDQPRITLLYFALLGLCCYTIAHHKRLRDHIKPQCHSSI